MLRIYFSLQIRNSANMRIVVKFWRGVMSMKSRLDLMVVKRCCPVCAKGHLLDEADRPGTVHAILYKPEDAQSADWFLKCPVCKRQIGVSPDVIDLQG